MAAGFGCFQVEVGVGCGRVEGIGAFSEEGVVERVDEQGGNGDAGQVKNGTGLAPVIFRALEAMQRRGIPVIEFPEVADGGESIQGNIVGVGFGFFGELFAEGADEAHAVDAVQAFFQLGGAVEQIHRNGDRHGGADDFGDGSALLPYIFQRHIPAQRKPDQVDMVVMRGDVVDDGLQVSCFATMVKTKRLVTFPAASPEIHGHGIHPAVIKNMYHTSYVRPGGTPFQPMENYHGAAAAGTAEIEVQEVVVGRGDAFARVLRRR